MDLLTHTKHRAVFLLAIIAGALILCATSCRYPLLGTNTTSSDSTVVHRYTSHRDTVVITPADSARIIAIVKSVTEMRRLFEELRANPRISRGEHNATVILRASGDTLIAEARCDSMAHVLQDAITTIQEKTDRISKLERTVTVQAATEKGTIPGWMEGVIWILVILLALAVTLAFIFRKQLFKLR